MFFAEALVWMLESGPRSVAANRHSLAAVTDISVQYNLYCGTQEKSTRPVFKRDEACGK